MEKFNVKDYGAIGDGKTINTRSINMAIEACNTYGGGIVFFPAGTYLSGSIRLKSNVNLSINEDTVILGAPNDIKAYDLAEDNPYDKYQDFGHSHWHNSLIWGENLENVSITGLGTIHGGGVTKIGDPKKIPVGGGNKAIALKLCKNVLIKDITINQGGHFAILATGCDNMTIHDLKIDTQRDGINIVSCRNVEVFNCQIDSVRYEDGMSVGGDDAIVLKSDCSLGYKRSSENITIKNCKLISGCNALQFGSETCDDFSNVTISNCIVEGAGKAGIGITSNDGSVIEGVTFSDIKMSNVSTPIFINITHRGRSLEPSVVGKIRNVKINNITATSSSFAGKPQFTSTIAGMDGHPVENIILNNVSLSYIGKGTKEQSTIVPPEPNGYSPRAFGIRPSYGFYCRHIKGIEFNNVEVKFEHKDFRPALNCDDGEDLKLNNFNPQRNPESDWDAIINNVKSFSMCNCSKTLQVKR